MVRSNIDHMRDVAELGCILCGAPAHAHHIGDSSERSDWLTIPLCPDHHTGANGFHGLGEREFNRRYKTNELRLLGLTIEKLRRGM